MTEFTSTPFKWSKSRYETFAACRRRYFYTYYGSRGGKKKNAPPEIREAYLLKQLTTLDMIRGSLIHVWVAQTIKRIKAGGRPSPDWAANAAMERIMEVVERSESITLHDNPEESTRLFEHEYGIPINENTIYDLSVRLGKCFENLYASKLLRYLAEHPDSIMIVEDNDTKNFFVGNVQCWAKLDLAYIDKDGVWQIVDWKTGSSEGDPSDLQARLYSYYIRKTQDVPVEKIRSRYIHLQIKKATEFEPYTEETMAELEEYVKERAHEMTGCLTDVERETAEIDNFPLTDEPRNCLRCNFKRLCGRE